MDEDAAAPAVPAGLPNCPLALGKGGALGAPPRTVLQLTISLGILHRYRRHPLL